MEIIRLNPNPTCCNVYLIVAGSSCVLVDCGPGAGDALKRYVAKHSLTCRGIVLTHGHFDHIAGLNEFGIDLPCPVFLHEEDEICLHNPRYNGSYDLLRENLEINPDIKPYLYSDLDELSFGEISLKVVHTPFHTEGSSCLYLEKEKTLFSGDALFKLSIGRTDLKGGSEKKVGDSLRKLSKLPPETKILPGHGPSTILSDEIRFNPYFQLA